MRARARERRERERRDAHMGLSCDESVTLIFSATPGWNVGGVHRVTELCIAEQSWKVSWTGNSTSVFTFMDLVGPHGPMDHIGKCVPFHWQCQSQLQSVQSQQLHTTYISARATLHTSLKVQITTHSAITGHKTAKTPSESRWIKWTLSTHLSIVHRSASTRWWISWATTKQHSQLSALWASSWAFL